MPSICLSGHSTDPNGHLPNTAAAIAGAFESLVFGHLQKHPTVYVLAKYTERTLKLPGFYVSYTRERDPMRTVSFDGQFLMLNAGESKEVWDHLEHGVDLPY